MSVRQLMLCGLFVLLFLSDYIVLSLGLGSVFAGWREYISILMILALSLQALASIAARGTLSRRVWRGLLVVVFFTTLYVLFGDFSEGSVRMFRALSIPVFVGMAVTFAARNVALEQKLREVFWAIVLMSLLTGLYALYQYLTIRSADQFWYWPLLEAKGYELQAYNSMREGRPRISGFFTGALEFSAVILNTAAMTMALLWVKGTVSRPVRYRLYLVLLLLCGLIVIGSVRTALIGLVCIFLMLLVTRVLRTPWLIALAGYVQMIGLTVAIFAYLSMGYTDDLSALDRERQWLHMFSVLAQHPMGYGFGAVGPGQTYWFDSFWLNLLATCGVIGLAMMAAMILWYHKLVVILVRRRSGTRPWEKAMSNFVIASCPFLLSSFFFQSYTNSVVLYLFVIVIMVLIGERKTTTLEPGDLDRSVSKV